MKKAVCIILCGALMALSVTIFPARAEDTSAAAVLIEAETGQVLYSKNADKRLPMASVTKVMALLLWAEISVIRSFRRLTR